MLMVIFPRLHESEIPRNPQLLSQLKLNFKVSIANATVFIHFRSDSSRHMDDDMRFVTWKVIPAAMLLEDCSDC